MSLSQVKTRIDRMTGQRDRIKTDIQLTEDNIEQTKTKLKNLEKAQAIVREVGKQTQEQLEFHISELVSLALSAVFDDPYEFKLKFVLRRGKTEADLLFIKNGQEMNPIDSSGGGPIDVASYALRVAMWSLAKPRTRAVLVLDEPFRFLSRDLQPRASKMLKMVHKKLGLQHIMVSHSPDLIDGADKIFEVVQQGQRSSLVGKRESE